jgi:hypothetical protein
MRCGMRRVVTYQGPCEFYYSLRVALHPRKLFFWGINASAAASRLQGRVGVKGRKPVGGGGVAEGVGLQTLNGTGRANSSVKTPARA